MTLALLSLGENILDCYCELLSKLPDSFEDYLPQNRI